MNDHLQRIRLISAPDQGGLVEGSREARRGTEGEAVVPRDRYLMLFRLNVPAPKHRVCLARAALCCPAACKLLIYW